jgi:hypothetical protein
MWREFPKIFAYLDYIFSVPSKSVDNCIVYSGFNTKNRFIARVFRVIVTLYMLLYIISCFLCLQIFDFNIYIVYKFEFFMFTDQSFFLAFLYFSVWLIFFVQNVFLYKFASFDIKLSRNIIKNSTTKILSWICSKLPKALYVIYTCTLCNSFVATMMFWLFLYDPGEFFFLMYFFCRKATLSCSLV